MKPLPFELLMDWAIAGYRSYGTIFGVSKIYKHRPAMSPQLTGDSEFAHSPLKLFGESLELPFGPAAGPHTQLAQNIISAYAAGARFFELKTVQELDGEDLPVSKPCILAADEGYNVEWSTELYVHEAMDEYIKAWFALKLISKEFELGDPDGFIFNMSVGYDYAGITSKKIDYFIENMKNAEDTEIWRVCKSWAKEKGFDAENISPLVSKSITLSTLHGCPQSDIEEIATYLMQEKGLNTYIKCNPTLLGYEYVRNTLDALGYGYIKFDDRHFENDLQFDDAVLMIRKLQKTAEALNISNTNANSTNIEFGIKLTNTLPVQITRGELPGEEMYMSGTPLFALTIETASRLATALECNINISYSGGADLHNITDIYEAGIWPVTICTTLLKPGGYNRCYPIAKKLEKCKHNILDAQKIQNLSDAVLTDRYYKKDKTAYRTKKNVPDTGKIVSCGCCINVCPNRANISLIKNGKPKVSHLDYLCNSCGNCDVFCQYYDTPCLENKK